MQIRPIRTEKDHELAVKWIEKLIGATPGSVEGDELEVLATLVDAYEAKNYTIDAPDPVTAIQFRMEQQGLSRKDLEPLIGSRARVSEILTRKRSLTLNMVRRVKSGLGISADLLIVATPIKARRAYGSHTARNTQPDKAKSAQNAA
jgi:HTH-type transcriptional regulator/antitoxin HigA